MKLFRDIKEAFRVTKGEEMARRYFVMNSFDGILTVLGILLGSWMVNGINPKTIIYVTFATCFAMFVSGFFGTFMTERAERERELKEMEKNMLKKLRNSRHGKAVWIVSIVSSLIDGVSSFIPGILIILPFFFVGILGISIVYGLSFLIAFILLFVLGAYLGRVSKESLFLNGIKMAGIGFLVTIIMFLLKIYV